jgi:hypothetical protein
VSVIPVLPGGIKQEMVVLASQGKKQDFIFKETRTTRAGSGLGSTVSDEQV